MYTIELKYRSLNTGRIFHHFFPAQEVRLARDYLDDAMACGCEILIWRLIPTDRVSVQ